MSKPIMTLKDLVSNLAKDIIDLVVLIKEDFWPKNKKHVDCETDEQEDTEKDA
jgi:hypothetical protein